MYLPRCSPGVSSIVDLAIGKILATVDFACIVWNCKCLHLYIHPLTLVHESEKPEFYRIRIVSATNFRKTIGAKRFWFASMRTGLLHVATFYLKYEYERDWTENDFECTNSLQHLLVPTKIMKITTHFSHTQIETKPIIPALLLVETCKFSKL